MVNGSNILLKKEHNLFKTAIALSIFTILANLVEGGFSTVLGASDETLALFGFGVDSFIEVISAAGVLLMVSRLASGASHERGRLEDLALRTTAVSFYLLAGGLVISAFLGVVTRHTPESTKWGIVISFISLATMIFLMKAKLKVGKQLSSPAIIADAHCTRVCIYMSIVLLTSSLVFSITGFGWLDAIGALGLAYYSFQEGRETWEKAQGAETCSCGDD